MSYTQLVTPDSGVEDYAGMCLRFTQSVYGAPVRYRSAWDAWEATQYKHTDQLPEASVPVWFSHYGTYGNPPSYENWGHVVAKIGDRFLSSPVGKLGTYGQTWFATIEEIERTFNAKYVGWSEDLNGLRIVEPGSDPTPHGKKKPLATVYHTQDNNGNLWAVADGSAVGSLAAWIDTRSQDEASGWARAFHLNEKSITVDQSEWLRLRGIYLGK